jgi:hypothetical protein
MFAKRGLSVIQVMAWIALSPWSHGQIVGAAGQQAEAASKARFEVRFFHVSNPQWAGFLTGPALPATVIALRIAAAR